MAAVAAAPVGAPRRRNEKTPLFSPFATPPRYPTPPYHHPRELPPLLRGFSAVDLP